MRRIAVLDAPSNLGLRPPTISSVPGCAKAPGALRDHGLLARLGARDAGCHTPPRFDPGEWQPGDGVSQAAEIAAYSVRLADRINAIIAAGDFPLVLGGDCSIGVGSALAMNRIGTQRHCRVGLIYVDAHSDFRHPGNAPVVGAAAGEALALITGRGQSELAGLEQRRPYVQDRDVVLIGLRPADEYRMDLQASGFALRPVPEVRTNGAARTAAWARGQVADCGGYWVHLDVDVLDPSVMPAVDAPTAGGIAYSELELLLRGLTGASECLGVEVTVFDPDFDPDGIYASDLASALVSGLSTVGNAPPLAAANPTVRSPELGSDRSAGQIGLASGDELTDASPDAEFEVAAEPPAALQSTMEAVSVVEPESVPISQSDPEPAAADVEPDPEPAAAAGEPAPEPVTVVDSPAPRTGPGTPNQRRRGARRRAHR